MLGVQGTIRPWWSLNEGEGALEKGDTKYNEISEFDSYGNETNLV